MRQWHVPPHLMCRRHLLGEHVEHHMIIGSLKKGRSLGKHAILGQIDTRTLLERHDAVAAEMINRGMNHKTPLDASILSTIKHSGWFDAKANYEELLRRCPECRARQNLMSQ